MVNLEQSGRMVSGLRTPDAWSADSSKIKEVLILKVIFSETTYHMCVSLRTKFQVSSKTNP